MEKCCWDCVSDSVVSRPEVLVKGVQAKKQILRLTPPNLERLGPFAPDERAVEGCGFHSFAKSARMNGAQDI